MIPELRFPEFKNDEDWATQELGQISEIVRGGSPRPIQDYLTTQPDALNWLKIADVSPDSKYITSTKEKVLKEALVSTREVRPGDLILSNSMSFGRPYILKTTTCIHDGWIAIRKISNITFEDYLYYFISSEQSQNFFNINAAGAAVKNLNADIIKQLRIHYPKTKKEQQKIATFLSSIDELIDAESAYLSSLQNHKKGLMQKLFPRPELVEGQEAIVPELRFKEFEGEWEAKTLGEVFTSYSGGTPSTTEKGYYGGNIPFIRSAEIHKSSTELYLTEEGIKNSSAKMVEKGDLLVALYGANSGEVAISKITGAINQAILCLKSEFSNEFTCQYLIFKKDWITTRYLQGGQGNLSGDIIKSIEFYFPSKEEQQKIASCLSSLDDLIAAQTQKIEQLKLHKKGLMQGLFPKMED